MRTYDLTHAWNFGGVVLSVGLGKGVVGGGKIRHEVSGDVVVVVVVMSDEDGGRRGAVGVLIWRAPARQGRSLLPIKCKACGEVALRQERTRSQ